MNAGMEQAIAQPRSLPLGPIGRSGIGTWGVGTLVASEAALFGYLLFSYYYLGATSPTSWVQEVHPSLKLALPNTILLLLSSVAAWYGEKGVERQRPGQALTGFVLAFVMGTVFAIVQYFEWRVKSYGPGTSSYGAIYFVTTGVHMAHVIAGLIILLALTGWTALGYFGPERRISVSGGVLYWHFVDIVWLFIFSTYYITPYLGFGI